MRTSMPSEGQRGTSTVSRSALCGPSLRANVCSCCTDNLQVQWGMQDHYEIVRKVGRGKYSEVSDK